MFPFKKYRRPCTSLWLYTQIYFDFIAITETRILETNFLANDINLTNYSHEYCLTESSARGTLLHIGYNLLRKPRNDLCI